VQFIKQTILLRFVVNIYIMLSQSKV